MFSYGTAIPDALEFRCTGDDAWYDVQVKLEGEDVLRVRFCTFSEDNDEFFNVNGFGSFSEVDALEARFRPLSIQFQDSDCRRVKLGMAVCASYSSCSDDVRFYDALVDEVDHVEHSYANGGEECLCSFVLYWQHGPNSGNLTIANIANMCQIQSVPLNNPVLPTFFRKVRDKIQIRLSKGDFCSEGQSLIHYDGSCQKDNCSPNFKHEPPFSQLMNTNQERRCAMRSMSELYKEQMTLCPRYSEMIEQDTDIGGMKYQYMILLENIDKGLSPLRLAKFLHEQTAILPRVYIFPSLASESYARGAVVLNCRKNLEGLYDFLDNPIHVIVSPRGRPLVVTGKVVRYDTFGELAGAMVLDADNKIWNQSEGGACNELKVLSPGTMEYIVAKKMKQLFMEFVSHQRRLHQSLAMEESKMYCSDVLQIKCKSVI